MKDASREDDDDVESMSANSNLLKKREALEIPDIPFCGCLSVRYYQPYFDVDTSDVHARIANALLYCRRENTFISLFDDKPDAYGPFWVSQPNRYTFLVYILGNRTMTLYKFVKFSK